MSKHLKVTPKHLRPQKVKVPDNEVTDHLFLKGVISLTGHCEDQKKIRLVRDRCNSII